MKRAVYYLTFACAAIIALLATSAGADDDPITPAEAGDELISLPTGTEVEKPIKIRWLGQASFLITTSEGATVLIDPANFKGYKFPEGLSADFVTVSHEHMDHNSVDKVAGTPVVFRGTDKDCSKVNTVDTTIGKIHLYDIPSYHNPAHTAVNAIFVFEFDGLRLVHLGDIGTVLTPDQISAIGPVDILMIPVGGKYTITSVEADSIVTQLKPKRYVFPMHYRTAAFEGLPYDAEPFLRGKPNVRRLRTNEFVFELEGLPTSPEYVVMQYQ